MITGGLVRRKKKIYKQTHQLGQKKNEEDKTLSAKFRRITDRLSWKGWKMKKPLSRLPAGKSL